MGIWITLVTPLIQLILKLLTQFENLPRLPNPIQGTEVCTTTLQVGVNYHFSVRNGAPLLRILSEIWSKFRIFLKASQIYQRISGDLAWCIGTSRGLEVCSKGFLENTPFSMRSKIIYYKHDFTLSWIVLLS
ncbi:unnamed protein product [Moneuplotes crassus]|uniref:Uncharacterized protein n=1 Tax=Euplotes crassus TaxID=5936 RepID=A0AAD1UPB9_EUPCR|nr:unnamed protein product [Moneuplotes crassus]